MPTNKPDIPNEIVQQVLDFLRSTPKAVGVLAASFISGHLWVFVLTAYFRNGTKGDTLIKSPTGRAGLGILWLTVVLIPYYALKYRDLPVDLDKILDIAIPTIVLGFFLQLVIFIVVINLKDKK